MDRTVAALEGNRDLVLVKYAPRLVKQVSEHINLRISSDDSALTNVAAYVFGSIPSAQLTVHSRFRALQMQIQEVLALVCWRRNIKASEYTLAVPDAKEHLEMDCSVADLEGKHDLMLVQRPQPTLLAEPTPGSINLRIFSNGRKFADVPVYVIGLVPRLHRDLPHRRFQNATDADTGRPRARVLEQEAQPAGIRACGARRRRASRNGRHRV